MRRGGKLKNDGCGSVNQGTRGSGGSGTKLEKSGDLTSNGLKTSPELKQRVCTPV
jgi:hypothetical protein